MKNVFIVPVQILFLAAANKLGYLMAERLSLPVPGSVLGMLLLLVLLSSGLMPLKTIEKGASLLVRHIALFLIPIAVGLMGFGELLIQNGIAILLALAVSIAVGISVTGLVSQHLARKGEDRVREHADGGL